MFESALSKYQLKSQLKHRMNMIGHTLSDWAWEDQVSHHMKHKNLDAVDLINAAINRREELIASQKKAPE